MCKPGTFPFLRNFKDSVKTGEGGDDADSNANEPTEPK